MTDSTGSSPPPGLDPEGVLPELGRLLDSWTAEYRDGRGAESVPAARQAEYQSRVVLAAFERAAWRPAPCSRSGESDWGSEPVVPMHRE